MGTPDLSLCGIELQCRQELRDGLSLRSLCIHCLQSFYASLISAQSTPVIGSVLPSQASVALLLLLLCKGEGCCRAAVLPRQRLVVHLVQYELHPNRSTTQEWVALRCQCTRAPLL